MSWKHSIIERGWRRRQRSRSRARGEIEPNACTVAEGPQEDPWKEFERLHKAGEVIAGQVTKLVPFGAFVRVAQGIEGLVHISELSHEHVDTPESVLSVGDEVQVKVVDVDVSRRRVSLSMRQVTPAPAKTTEIEVEPSTRAMLGRPLATVQSRMRARRGPRGGTDERRHRGTTVNRRR